MISKNNDQLVSQSMKNYDSCQTCVHDLVRITNILISTAFSNRFLSELSSQDEVLLEVAAVLRNLASILHLLGGNLMSYIVTHGIHYEHIDPMVPSWNVGMSMVYESNKQMVNELKIFLDNLKAHGHARLRNFLKSQIRETELVRILDDLALLVDDDWRNFLENESNGKDEDEAEDVDEDKDDDEDKFEPSVTSTPRNTDEEEKDEEKVKIYENVAPVKKEKESMNEGFSNLDSKEEPIQYTEETTDYSGKNVEIVLSKSPLVLKVNTPDIELRISKSD